MSGISSQVILSPDIVLLWRGQTSPPTGLRTPSATFLPRLARRGLNDIARFAGFRSLPLILAPMGQRPGTKGATLIALSPERGVIAALGSLIISASYDRRVTPFQGLRPAAVR